MFDALFLEVDQTLGADCFADAFARFSGVNADDVQLTDGVLVDEVLMDHPAVAQVVCFGLPHPKLGEEVAAVVVCREGQSVDERSLQAFVGQRLADFKVPARILFMDEIPKGATGKLQRIGLAQKLGLT